MTPISGHGEVLQLVIILHLNASDESLTPPTIPTDT